MRPPESTPRLAVSPVFRQQIGQRRRREVHDQGGVALRCERLNRHSEPEAPRPRCSRDVAPGLERVEQAVERGAREGELLADLTCAGLAALGEELEHVERAIKLSHRVDHGRPHRNRVGGV